MATLVLSTKCGNWVYGRCANVKIVTPKLARYFVWSRCREMIEGTVDSIEQ